MSALIRNHRNGFTPGLTWIIRLDEPEPNTGIAFGVLRLASGESFCQSMDGETAALLMFGEARFRAGDIDLVADRNSLFDDDHAQVAAPGYGMYYSWVIRHLPDNPYTVPEFTDDHSWTMNPDAETWHPFAKDASR